MCVLHEFQVSCLLSRWATFLTNIYINPIVGRGLPWHVGQAVEAKPNCVTDCRQPWKAKRMPFRDSLGGSVVMTSLS